MIGSGYGFSVVCLALAMKDNGRGTLSFVDPSYSVLADGPLRTIGGTSQWDSPVKVRKHFQRFGVEHIVTHYRLKANPDYEVVMTRDTDTFLSLKQRVAVARQNQADLFIAVHADTVRGASVRGATLYTLSEKASDAEAEALAQKENRSDTRGNP